MARPWSWYTTKKAQTRVGLTKKATGPPPSPVPAEVPTFSACSQLQASCWPGPLALARAANLQSSELEGMDSPRSCQRPLWGLPSEAQSGGPACAGTHIAAQRRPQAAMGNPSTWALLQHQALPCRTHDLSQGSPFRVLAQEAWQMPWWTVLHRHVPVCTFLDMCVLPCTHTCTYAGLGAQVCGRTSVCVRTYRHR